MIGEEYTGDMESLFKGITQSELLLYKGYRWGMLTEDEMNAQLATLAARDNRQQISRELLRTPVNSTTTAAISGNVGVWNTRASVNYIYDAGDFRDNTWRLNWDNNFRFNKWIAFSAGFNLTGRNAHASLIGFSDIASLSPYEMLLNDDGSYATDFHHTYNADVLSKYHWSGFTYNNMNYNLCRKPAHATTASPTRKDAYSSDWSSTSSTDCSSTPSSSTRRADSITTTPTPKPPSIPAIASTTSPPET